MTETAIIAVGQSPAAAECEEVSVRLAAYLVHLVWSDIAHWDGRRRLRREEAEAFAERLAVRLPEDVRTRLEALRARHAA